MSDGTIVVATDFSEGSDRALEYASTSAKTTGAKLLIAHVRSIPEVAHGEGMLHAGMEYEDEGALLRRLQSIEPEIDGVAYEHRLLRGNPAQQIIQLAKDENAALIVMGTHGRTGLMRLLMGSVAEEVVRQAPCPVLTVKIPGKDS